MRFIEFDRGGVTNFVVCFCEDGDVLSQWRGYADNGKGCSLGFSVKQKIGISYKTKRDRTKNAPSPLPAA